MRLWRFSRSALLLGILAGLLAGCLGRDNAPAVPGTAAAPAGPQVGGPRKWDLLYVSNGDGTVDVFRYWQRLLYKTLKGFSAPRGECTDSKHDVYITDSALAEIVTYYHASTTPLRTLTDTGYQPFACSSDPTTGNLAVANYLTAGSKAGNVAIYADGSGKPKFYQPNLGGHGPFACAYDNAGNLLIATEYGNGSYETALFAVLYKGATTFARVKLSKITQSQFQYVTNVQWDGKYWAIADNGNIVRYTIAQGKTPAYESTTTLSGNGTTSRFWIANFTGSQGQGTQIVAAESQAVLFWKYPAGGEAIGSITQDVYQPYGVAVSLAPLK